MSSPRTDSNICVMSLPIGDTWRSMTGLNLARPEQGGLVDFLSTTWVVGTGVRFNDPDTGGNGSSKIK